MVFIFILEDVTNGPRRRGWVRPFRFLFTALTTLELVCLTGFFLSFSSVDLGSSGLTGFYWVLLGLTGFYWVLLGFTGFYWVLRCFTGFHAVLLGSTGSYWFFTRFYWVFLGFY